jgi:type II secretory pathway pseudopilin PulG
MRVGQCPRIECERGYALAALLVAVSVMAVLLSMALPVWKTAVQREREAELVFRGEQYARAIGLYQRQFANALPLNLDVLVDEGFLRKRYRDPMVSDGEFASVLADTVAAGDAPTGDLGGIVGVTSRSTGMSLRRYNGADRYDQWLFLAIQFSQEAGGVGVPSDTDATGVALESR